MSQRNPCSVGSSWALLSSELCSNVMLGKAQDCRCAKPLRGRQCALRLSRWYSKNTRKQKEVGKPTWFRAAADADRQKGCPMGRLPRGGWTPFLERVLWRWESSLFPAAPRSGRGSRLLWKLSSCPFATAKPSPSQCTRDLLCSASSQYGLCGRTQPSEHALRKHLKRECVQGAAQRSAAAESTRRRRRRRV